MAASKPGAGRLASTLSGPPHALVYLHDAGRASPSKRCPYRSLTGCFTMLYDCGLRTQARPRAGLTGTHSSEGLTDMSLCH